MNVQKRFDFDETSFSNVDLPSSHTYAFSSLITATSRSLELAIPSPQVLEDLTRALSSGRSLAVRTAATVLANRGVHSVNDLNAFLSPSTLHLPNPSAFLNFDQAVDVILQVIKEYGKIGIIGDYDVDGITSVAQFISTLNAIGAHHHYWIPNRFVDGYGISARIVDELIESGCSLAVLFDNGSNSHEHIAKLRAHGIQVVVFDHHPLETPPDCILVNPRQLTCGLHHEFPSASGLSACLNTRLQEILTLPKSDMSLAALGTIADMVPLRGMNRTIARVGLLDMRRGSNLGLAALARRNWLVSEDLTSSDIGFLLGPCINAAGRLGDASLCVELLVTRDPNRAREIADKLYELNGERKTRQRHSVVANYIRLAHSKVLPSAIVSFDSSHHAGLNGLVAQGLASRYARPAFVFSANHDGSLTGSARNGHSSFDLSEMLSKAKAVDTKGVILRAGGHVAAAGVTIQAEGLDSFRQMIGSIVDESHPDVVPQVAVVADSVLTFRELTPSFVSQVDRLLEPYGQGFASPQYLFQTVTVKRIEEYDGGRHMLELIQEPHKAPVRAFVGPEIWNGDIHPGATISMVASPAAVYRNQKRFVQLSVSGYRVERMPAIPQASHSGSEWSAWSPVLSLAHVNHNTSDTPVQPEETVLDENGSISPSSSQAFDPAPLSSSTQKDFQLTQPLLWDAEVLDVLSNIPTSPSRFKLLKAEKAHTASHFDASYLYPELAGREPDHFAPRTDQENQDLWDALITRCDLAIDASGLEYRPWSEEAVRFFFDAAKNVLLHAPPGSGKSEIALSIASHYRKHGRRVTMVAPTIEIVRQLSGRVRRLLGEDAAVLDGISTAPEERSRLYASDLGFIIATPHVIANDIKLGTFHLRPDDLLIIDEVHHATGNSPEVVAINAAKKAGTRMLALSATPAQVLPGKQWDRLAGIKNLLNIDTIFPLNVNGNRCDLSTRFLELPAEIREAETLLAQRTRRLQEHVLQYLDDKGLTKLEHDASRLFGRDTPQFPSTYHLNSLCASLRELPTFQDWEIHEALRAIGELSHLRLLLVETGISSFLSRCITQRFHVTFPPELRRGAKSLYAPMYLRSVYEHRDVELAFIKLAREAAIPLWSHYEHARILGISRVDWNNLTQKERTVLFNRHVSETKQRVLATLVASDYSDHPKEAFLLADLARHAKRSFVSTYEVDHAIFLAKRISHLLSEHEIRAVSLTGAGQGTRKGISRKERAANLAAFNSHEASVLVGTSAAEEGNDYIAERGYAFRFNGSQTRATQVRGRVGRHTVGHFTYLCSTREELATVNRILKKEVYFQEMLNQERSRILAAKIS